LALKTGRRATDRVPGRSQSHETCQRPTAAITLGCVEGWLRAQDRADHLGPGELQVARAVRRFARTQ
jgi:hypothetical protein